MGAPDLFRFRGALDRIHDVAHTAPTVDQLELYRDVIEALERARSQGRDLGASAVAAITRWEKRNAVSAPPPSDGAISKRSSDR